ncbi:MAG: hypothetical protein EU532_01110 [Promethearchaeota archaeon]|nr:MAG: hypothetical protein EU532_01110 [Candidatus Lokiarchaeota archaeon]
MHEKINEYDSTLEAVNSLKNKIKSLKAVISEKSCFLGFDGFIDSLYSVIQSRESVKKFKSIENMQDFGKIIMDVAGSSLGLNLYLKRKTSGGFTSNVCKALNMLEVKQVFLASAWGYPNILDIFTPLASKNSVNVNSFANPGRTIGLEFNDGKIMLSDIDEILNINWSLIHEKIGLDYLIQKFNLCDLIGMGYWATILQFEDILYHTLMDVIPSVKNSREKLLFLDLADVKRRTKKDLISFLKSMPKIEEKIPLLLSLNDQEAKDVLLALNENKLLKTNKKDLNNLTDAGIYINEILNISYLVIHSPHFATITNKERHFWITEGFTSKPRYTTSAGDHFNAGLVLGLACNLSPAEALVMGNALTAIFVRTGKSPNFEELSQFIQKYMEYIKTDNPDFP